MERERQKDRKGDEKGGWKDGRRLKKEVREMEGGWSMLGR